MAIHTLIAAAAQILSDLLRHRGLPDFVYNNPSIRPEKRSEWARLVRAPANFFKHADKDPRDEHELNPETNGLQLLGALMALQQLGVSFTAAERAFWLRFGLECPSIIADDDPFAKAIAGNQFSEIAALPRLRFYTAFMRQAAALGPRMGNPKSKAP